MTENKVTAFKTFVLWLLLAVGGVNAQVVVGPSNFVAGPSQTGSINKEPETDPRGNLWSTTPAAEQRLPVLMGSQLRPDGSSKHLGQTQQPLMSSASKEPSEIVDLSASDIARQPLQSASLTQRNARKIIPILMLLLDEDTTAETIRQVGEFDFFESALCCKFGIGGLTRGDFNGDGLLDVVFAGRATQHTAQADWVNARVQLILQKPEGGFSIGTDVLIAPGEGIIEGTEPAVVISDFNADGIDDFFLAGGTDSDYIVPSYLYLSNRGSTHVRHTIHTGTWNHHAIGVDIDGDGIKEILVSGYFSQLHVIKVSNGSVQLLSTDGATTGSSSLAAGRFLNNGGLQVIRSDVGNANSADDLQLFDTQINSSNRLELAYVSTLPTPALHNTPGVIITQGASHEYRIHTTDINQDGLDDLIVLSSPPPGFSGPSPYSEMEFLQNQGNGQFVAVTGQVRLNFDNHVGPNYNLRFLDINGDGCQDMFYDGLDFDGLASKFFLISDCQGRFFVKGRAKLLQLIQDMTRGLQLKYPAGSTPMALVPGPNGKLQILYVAYVQAATGFKVKVLSAIFNNDLLQ